MNIEENDLDAEFLIRRSFPKMGAFSKEVDKCIVNYEIHTFVELPKEFNDDLVKLVHKYTKDE